MASFKIGQSESQPYSALLSFQADETLDAWGMSEPGVIVFKSWDVILECGDMLEANFWTSGSVSAANFFPLGYCKLI